MSFFPVQSTVDTSKIMQNYLYLQVNFLVTGNLLRDISRQRKQESKCKFK